jgi:death on curing protein
MTGHAEEPEGPWSGAITVMRVLDLHDRGLAEYGGPAGPAQPQGCVEGTLGAAVNAEMYAAAGRRHSLPGLLFASYLLVYLARRHCFVDGNKRTAWSSAVDALASLGLGFTATSPEAVQFVNDVATGAVDDGPQVAAWFAPRLFALQ